MVKKRIWKDVVTESNSDEGLDGGMKLVRVGIKETLGKPTEEADTGIATSRAQNGNMVSGSKGKQEHKTVTWSVVQRGRGKY